MAEQTGTRPTIWTLGHSTHPASEFWELIRSHKVKTLVDIRRYPGSRRYPHFSKDALAQAAPDNGVRYVWMESLGGRRKAKPDSRNVAWRNEQFRAYADFMETPVFHHALEELCTLARQAPTAILCSEAVWWQCHRGLIADVLKVRGWRVEHIFSTTKVIEHPFTSAAKVENGRVSYEG